jgi:hypothetical protein
LLQHPKRILCLALFVPQTGQADRSSKFPRFGILLASYLDGLEQAGFSLSPIILHQQYFPTNLIELCFPKSFECAKEPGASNCVRLLRWYLAKAGWSTFPACESRQRYALNRPAKIGLVWTAFIAV